MRIMALDVGIRRIGVAVSDPLLLTAQGVCTIERHSVAEDIAKIQDLIQQYEVSRMVIGLPLHMNGSEGESVEMARQFGAALAAVFAGEIVYRDERLTTVAAEKLLIHGDVSRKKRKQVVDKIAAAVILQNYLDYLSFQRQEQ